jgi:tetratricopeptide (TPR) repeat protein
MCHPRQGKFHKRQVATDSHHAACYRQYVFLRCLPMAAIMWGVVSTALPDTVTDLLQQAQTAIERKQFDTAVTIATKAIAVAPASSESYRYRSIGYLRLRDFKLATADAARAVELNSRNPDAYMTRGDCFWRQKNLELAIADYSRAIALDPKRLNALYRRAILFLQVHDLAKAIGDCSAARQLAPSNVPTRRLLYLLLRLSEHKETVILTETTQWIRDASTPREKALACYERGLTYRAIHEYDKERSDYDEALRFDPECSVAYIARGRTYCYFKDKKDYDAPIADFTRGIELNPYDICGYCGRAPKYGSIGQAEKANQDFQMVRQLGREEIDSPMIYIFIRGQPISIAATAE